MEISDSSKTLKKARLLFLTLIVLFALAAALPVYFYASNFDLKQAFNKFKTSFEGEIKVSIDTNLRTSTPVATIKPKVTSFATFRPVRTSTTNFKKECYRYKVTHLDGSTSYLCYNSADYNQLTDLGYKYSSAKTFYEFHLDGAGDYQAQYDITGSTVYLDAKKSQERQAESEKQKMNSIIGQMQEIEKRGY